MLVVVGIALALLIAVSIPHHEPWDLAVIVVPFAASVWLAHRFTAHFRRAPAGFPAATPSTGLRVAQAGRTSWRWERKDAP